jgi:hypothetical protein
LHRLFSSFNLGCWFLQILLLMYKQILKDFCQYHYKLTGIFLIPFIFLDIFIPLILFTTHTIEYNLGPIYFLPLFCSHQCYGILVKILDLLPLINDKYNVKIYDKIWQTKLFVFQ